MSRHMTIDCGRVQFKLRDDIPLFDENDEFQYGVFVDDAAAGYAVVVMRNWRKVGWRWTKNGTVKPTLTSLANTIRDYYGRRHADEF